MNGLILKASADGAKPREARLTANHEIGSGYFVCDNLAGWASKASFTVYEIDDDGEPVAGSDTDWIADLNNNVLQNAEITSGVDRPYQANRTVRTVLVADYTAGAHNKLAEALLKTLKPDGTPIKDLIYNPGYNDFNHSDLLKEGRWVFSLSSTVNAMANKPVGQAGWLETKILTKGQYPGVHPWGYAQQEYQAIDGNTYVRLISSGETPLPVNFRKWVKKLREANNEVGKDAIKWKDVFPIGEFKYLSKNVDPNTLYSGTTWTRRTGYFLWAGEDGGSYSVGKTFGSSTHTLTVNEMPAHTHLSGGSHNLPNPSGGWISGQGANRYLVNDGHASSIGGYGLTNNHQSKGGSKPHNNMPPARSVYLWERTA